MLNNKLSLFITNSFKSKLFSNSFWGVFSNILQNILYSVFFIVIARKYSINDFSNYIISNTLYGFVLAFSSLGLGQWFIRELVIVKDKRLLIDQFFKIQFIVGLIFYILNILLSFALYDNVLIRNLSILVGINIIFDNIIYVIKFVNIATFEQKRTFLVLTIEAVLKFLTACFLFIYQLPILYLALVLILLRFITLNLFLKIGSSFNITISNIFNIKLSTKELKNIIFSNWTFIVIGSIAVVYWKIGNIIVSKFLSIEDVANYEISFKLFSIAQILPVIVSTSIFPTLVKLAVDNIEQFTLYYKKIFFIYAIYGLVTYTFVYSYAELIVPILFGDKYILTALYAKEMFLTILIFPTALLQANFLVALKKEKIDMWLNLMSLFLNLCLCFIGLYYFKSLSVINFSVFISFILFHLMQDFFLFKLQISNIKHFLLFIITSIFIITTYRNLIVHSTDNLFFFYFWLVLLVISGILFYFFSDKFISSSIRK